MTPFWCLQKRFFGLVRLATALMVLLLSLAPEAICKTKASKEVPPSTLSEERRKLEVYDFKEKGLLQELALLEKEVARKRKEVEGLKQELEGLKRSISSLRKKAQEVKALSKEIESRLAERLVVIYKYARRGYLKVLASAGDLDEFRRRLTYVSRLMASDKGELERLNRRRISLARELSTLEREISSGEARLDARVERLATLQKEMERQVIRLMKIHREREFYETAVKELEGAADKLKYVVIKTQEKPSKKQAFQWGHFKAQRGRLLPPCEGRLIRGRKFFRSRRNHLHKGIFIRAASGAKVRAVFSGRVEYSGLLKGYGQVIIINHGEKFFTISALLAERKKEEGDFVKTGDIIGTIKGTGGPLGPTLYFEIRYDGRHLDPLKWLDVSKG